MLLGTLLGTTLGQDLRYAARMMAETPGYTLVATLTLALGIGANRALFSVVKAILLRPFPYGEPERLVVVWETQLAQGIPAMFASPPNYRDWRAQQTVFEEMAAFAPRSFFLTQNGEPARLQGARVSATLFPLLRTRPCTTPRARKSENLSPAARFSNRARWNR
jgi:putative ABC transport system permease protein